VKKKWCKKSKIFGVKLLDVKKNWCKKIQKFWYKKIGVKNANSVKNRIQITKAYDKLITTKNIHVNLSYTIVYNL